MSRALSPFHVPLDHQLAILEAQLSMAVELKRNVSLHSVKAHQATVNILHSMKAKYGERWLRISLDLHSCGLSAQMWSNVEVRMTTLPRRCFVVHQDSTLVDDRNFILMSSFHYPRASIHVLRGTKT
jgi:Tat protein secretion system quality control protein TatD with DNase activity